jgi:hypothetical protein
MINPITPSGATPAGRPEQTPKFQSAFFSKAFMVIFTKNMIGSLVRQFQAAQDRWKQTQDELRKSEE